MPDALPLDSFQAIAAAETLEAVFTRLQHETETAGLSCYAIGDQPPPESAALPQFFHSSWPKTWLDRYVSGGYVTYDPCLQYIAENVRPVTFTEMPKQGWMTPPQHAMWQDVQAHGFTEGLVVPIHNLQRPRAAAVYAGSVQEADPAAFPSLYLIALYAHERLRNLGREDAPGVILTAREQEVLSGLARGLTDDEIGHSLAISVRTVRFHLNQARIRLEARTRAQAVAIAVYRGLITP